MIKRLKWHHIADRIRIEEEMMDLGQGLHYPVINYSINDDAKEVILTPGDLDDENES